MGVYLPEYWHFSKSPATPPKRVPIIRGFLFKKMTFLCTLATKWAKISSIYSKITKVGGMFRDFPAQNHTPCLGISWKKVTHLSGTPPFTILGEYPPPPSRRAFSTKLKNVYRKRENLLCKSSLSIKFNTIQIYGIKT